MSLSVNGIKRNARIQVEQDFDPILKNLKFKKLGKPCDEMLLTTGRRYKHYRANEDRINLKDDLKNYQILITKQLVDEVHRSLHGVFGNHLGITKIIIAYRQMYYYPNKTRLN